MALTDQQHEQGDGPLTPPKVDRIETTVEIPKYEDGGGYLGESVKVESTELGRDFVKVGYGNVVRVSDLHHALNVLLTAQRDPDIPF